MRVGGVRYKSVDDVKRIALLGLSLMILLASFPQPRQEPLGLPHEFEHEGISYAILANGTPVASKGDVELR